MLSPFYEAYVREFFRLMIWIVSFKTVDDEDSAIGNIVTLECEGLLKRDGILFHTVPISFNQFL